MRAFKTLTSVAALAAALAVSSAASAATIIIQSSLNGGALVVQNTGTDAAAASFVAGIFDVNIVSGIAGIKPLLNTSDNTRVDTAAGTTQTLDIFVTAEGLTGPTSSSQGFVSAFQTNFLPTGWSLVERTWMDPTNSAPPAPGVPLSSQTFLGGPLVQQATGSNFVNTGAGPYSLTAEYLYTVNAGATGNPSSTISIAAIPEPATWGLMIMGFGGLGAVLRGRRRQQVALA